MTLPQPTKAAALDQIPLASDHVPLTPAGLDVTVLADKLRRYFDGKAEILDELLDPTIGTPFQRRVWAITRAIPRGQGCIADFSITDRSDSWLALGA